MSVFKLPYRVQHSVQQFVNLFYYVRALLACALGKPRHGCRIWVTMGYQAASGGTEAICAVANSLASYYPVSCDLTPLSAANRWMSSRVDRGFDPDEKPDMVICDRAADLDLLGITAITPVICSVHGGLNTLHGLEAKIHLRSIERADLVHFVSTPQADEFVEIVKKGLVIPNFIPDIFPDGPPITPPKYDIGMVGYFVRPEKNLPTMLAVLKECVNYSAVTWGSLPEGLSLPANVIAMGVSTNKIEIFSSMSVLLALSTKENLPLVVLQALCAGIPCVLSDIPAHREIAKKIGLGVVVVNTDDAEQVRTCLDEALALSTDVRSRIRDGWLSNYSELAVMPIWREVVEGLINDCGDESHQVVKDKKQ